MALRLALSTLLSAVLIASAPATFSSQQTYNPKFLLEEHLGNLSPFFTPTPQNGLKGALGVGMPEGCALEQVHMLGRHGSRFPLSLELPYITNLSRLLNSPDVSSKLDRLSLPMEFDFLKGDDRWSVRLGTNNLTAIGRMQLFDHGAEFAVAYPEMPFEHVLAGDQDRVIESAQWFRAGLFGRYADQTSSFSLIAEDNITISAITPMDTCPKWTYSYGQQAVDTWGAVYLLPIQKRLNKILKPVTLSTGDVHGALYACAYETAANGTSPWCGVFESEEILDFEYELDLLMRSAFGYGLPGDMGPILGSVFVNQLVDRLQDPSANKTFLEFGHDTSIDMALTALGLASDSSYPPTGPPSPSRSWRTSYQVPFGAQMVWEKWTCSSNNTQIRLLLNGAPYTLQPLCPTSINKTTGSCSLQEFVRGTEGIRGVKWGDGRWNGTCGNPGF